MSFLNDIKPNEPVVTLDGYLIAMLGKAKFGKTTFAIDLARKFYGNLDSTLLLGCEVGYKAIKGIHAIPIVTFNKTTDDKKELKQYGFIETVNELIENASEIPYKFIIIDTVTALEKYAVEHIIKTSNKKDTPDKKYTDISDILWGKGHNAVAKEIDKQIDRLIKNGFGIFAIGHEKVSTITNKDGFEYDYIGFDLSKKTSAIITREADLIIYGDLQVEKNKKGTKENRRLLLRSDGNILCGSRIGEFPNELPVDAEAFIEAFNNAILDIYDGDAEKVKQKTEMEQKEKSEIKKMAKKIVKSKSLDGDENDDDDIDDDEIAEDDIEEIERIIEEIDGLMVDMKKSDKLKCSKYFKEILGTNNYKQIDNQKLLKEALEFVESL